MSSAKAEATETLVQVGEFNVKVQIAGDGPPVVLIHGAGGISDAPGLAMLTEAHRTYAIEVPGFGSSPLNEKSPSLRALASTVSGAIEKLEIGSHAVIGTSVGARLALWHAIDSGEQVESLILVSPAAILPEGVAVPTIAPQFLLRSVGTGSASPTGFAFGGAQEEQLLGRIFGSGRDDELEQAMSSLEVPTLVLFGDEDFQVPAETGRIYQELMPTCFYILVHRAGSLIAHERPEAFASVVGDFLEYREQFIYSHKTGVLNP